MLSRILSVLVVSAAIALGLPHSAVGVTLPPPDGRVLVGVAMGSEVADFARRTGRRPAVWQQFVAFDRPFRWAIDLAEDEGARPMLGVSTASGQDQPGTISPAEIAAGRGDRWLVTLRNALAAYPGGAYVRFLAEMNNCRNAYAPLACSGRSRGASHSATAFIAAWRRAAAIMRGASFPAVDAQLQRLGQRALRAPTVPLVPAHIAMVWSPMTGGSPMVDALDPARFWPGSGWVDWVGTSFYSKYPRFDWLTAYYGRFAERYRKPFMLAEWAMWENGDPGFVRGVLDWTRAHPRTRMLVYNQGKDPNGPFRLGGFPAAALALRTGLAGRLFSGP